MAAPCETCGQLPLKLFVNTGSGEHLPAAVDKLKRLWNRTGNNAVDVLQCPGCGAWFEWRDETAWTGSGNGDGEWLERLPPEAWLTFERFLHGDLSGVDGPAFVHALFSDARWSDLYLSALNASGRADELCATYAPALVERMETAQADPDRQQAYVLLRGWAYDSFSSPGTARCEHLRAALRARQQTAKLSSRGLLVLEDCRKVLAR